MGNDNIAIKVKDLRIRKGYSQEYLAEESKLSLRTIQRIESGESVPRGDTLIKLTKALGVTPDDLLDWTKMEDNGYLKLLNFSALTGVFIHPILGIIIPLAMWTLKKDKVNLVDDYGRKLINFQITWTLLLYSIFIIYTKGTYIGFDFNIIRLLRNVLTVGINKELYYGFFLMLIYLFNIIMIFINLKRITKGVEGKYFLAIPFLR